MVLVAGLLVLAGLGSDMRPASAQTQADCALPAGVAPPPDPRVTAQQVESGSGRLEDFALAATRQFRHLNESITTLGQFSYFSCLLRQEGSPWRSGATYIVTLSLNGRLTLHAEDMALSGRLLHPLVYGEILSRLGLDFDSSRVLADPTALDDELARLQTALANVAATGMFPNPDGGRFDLPAVPNVSPGASGYASSYASASTAFGGLPFVALAGFDLDSSHVVQERIDHADPAITARDVVDRRTLKAFVTGAGRFVTDLRQSGDPVASAQALVALRDPNGPWRHGSVYLYILDSTTDTILFHGAFPNRFELRPLVPTQRDAVTGELILPRVLEAARSSPEGGFVQYHFDDPADDSDSADIPKVGYAREFTASVPRPDGTRFPTTFIVGSGFYLSDPGVVAARENTVVESVLPQIMRAMTAGTVDAVSSRIERAASGTAPAEAFSLGGVSTPSDVLLAHGRSLQDGTFDIGRLLAGSSFTVPLNAAGAGRGGGSGHLTFWGSGDYRSISGGSGNGIGYDGGVVSGNLGVDARLSADLLAGLSLARSQGDVDYTDPNAVTGELTTTLTSINPYVGWQGSGGRSFWAAAGHGWGEVEVDDASAAAQTSDLTQQMAAAGLSGPLAGGEGEGAVTLRIKAETAFTWAEVDGSGTIERTKLNASRHRLMIEGAQVRKLDSGAELTPSVEIGLRHDGGDGETGSSVETGGGVRYADAESGLTIEGRVRTLLSGSGEYEEWGVSGLIRLDPGTSDLGLAFSVLPQWGQTASGVGRMWDSPITRRADSASEAMGRVKARIAYGIGTTSSAGRGVLAPYADVSLSGAGARRASLGGRFVIGTSVTMSLEGVHSQPAFGAAEHGVMLRADLNW